jgi:hypothetical protein
MIYQFETQAGGRITYTDVVGAEILHLIGKQAGPRGVITVDEIPSALQALEAAVVREKARGQAVATGQRSDLEPHATDGTPRDDEREREPVVTLGQRAYPFVDLLKFALQQRENVTWGI